MENFVGHLSESEQEDLQALGTLLDLLDEEDWYPVHQTVARDVASGENSREFETAYANMTRIKSGERAREES